MKQHLFFSSKCSEPQNFHVNAMISNEAEFINEVNLNPGYLFLFSEYKNEDKDENEDSDEDKLYKAKIKEIFSIYKKEINDVKDNVFIHTTEASFKIIVEDLEIIDKEELKLLYARSNKNKVGIYSYSIFHTCRRNFRYARPLLANEVVKSELVPYLLDDYYIIPAKESNLYGRLIEEDGEYIITLINDKMIKLDHMYLDQDFGEQKV